MHECILLLLQVERAGVVVVVGETGEKLSVTIAAHRVKSASGNTCVCSRCGMRGRRGRAFRAACPLRLLPQFPFCVSVEIREQKQLVSWLHSEYKVVRTLRIQIATVNAPLAFLAKDDLSPRPSAPPPLCRPVPHLDLKVVNWKNIIQE